MRNLRLLLQYDGTNYSGWQSQPRGTATIQGVIEDSIERLTGQRAVLVAAGRTDAGVHALGQVAAFATGSTLDAPTVLKALNALLPPDIRVLEALDVPEGFHPRFDATSKSYLYFIGRTKDIPVFLRRFVCPVPYRLDTGAMAEAGQHLVGPRRDFTSMRGAGCGAKSAMREIKGFELQRTDAFEFMSLSLQGEFIRVRVRADAFLRHMVRNIVGTLIDVGRGRTPASDMPMILDKKDRAFAGPTAPPQGLFLEKVDYSRL